MSAENEYSPTDDALRLLARTAVASGVYSGNVAALRAVYNHGVAAERERCARQTPNATELLDLFNSEVHAPPNTHSGYDGSCSECPWPLHQLPPEDMAREIAAWLYDRATRPDDREETDRG